ncbi:PAS domain S-box protein [Oxalobacteraceae bacterium]|nr:PAS domain S-box protein [Oxalobacteraceae bacterium]
MTNSLTPPLPPVDDNRFRLFVASVTDYAIYTLSAEGIVNSWNAGAQRFKGYTADEIIGTHFSAFYTPQDKDHGVPQRALRTATERGKFEDEGWRVRKDGTQFWAHVVIDAVKDADGQLIGFAKITRDITERKRAAEVLHASEERFRLLVQGVTDYAIYMLSPEGVITNWNAGARRIKGYEQDEILGNHFSRFYTEEDRKLGMPMSALATAAREGRFENEGWRVRKDGSQFWAHVVIDPIRNTLGELVGYAKVTRDITERRQTALALEKARETLFHSQKLEAIGKLTGGVAHDFNNLLSVMANGLGVLRHRLKDPTDLKVIDAMERATSRGATLTRQLLSFARQQPLKQEHTNLNEVIGAFEAVLKRAVRNSLSFATELAERLPTVLADAAQVEACILNLIVNAQDATPDGGAINLRTEAVTLQHGEIGTLPAGQYVKVMVSDTGSGMDQDVVARAVEPFFTTKPIGKGTGLGLSQAYGLMQQSGGDLKIDSVPGAGTSVQLYFPALEAKTEGVAANEPREKALVVDDQEDVLDMAVELFRMLGYDVVSATSGAEALTILQRDGDINILFSDVLMPGMSGIELGHAVRRMAPHIKIILASGYTAPALGADNSGGEDFPLISKPYTLAQIVRQLR